jgi:hypothetical protein
VAKMMKPINLEKRFELSMRVFLPYWCGLYYILVIFPKGFNRIG